MTTLTSITYDSPVGTLTLVASGVGLRAVMWPGEPAARVGLADDELERGDAPVLTEAARQLDAYFAGTRTTFDLPLDLEGTPFQVAVWRALGEIPYGQTRTYAEQAARVGRPRAVRAVGAANGRNPISIVLPCHRVVGSDGSLTGFAGGIDVKAWLLRLEAGHPEGRRAGRTAGVARAGQVPPLRPRATGGRLHARSRAPSSKPASPEEPASPARAGRNRGT